MEVKNYYSEKWEEGSKDPRLMGRKKHQNLWMEVVLRS